MRIPVRLWFSRILTMKFCLMLSILGNLIWIVSTIYRVRQPCTLIQQIGPPLKAGMQRVWTADGNVENAWTLQEVADREKVHIKDVENWCQTGKIFPKAITVYDERSFYLIPKGYTIKP